MPPFDKRSQQRIARVVREVERSAPQLRQQRKHWPSPGGNSVIHVIFEAASAGIADGQTVNCTAISYSDGRNATGDDATVDVENQTGETVCNTGSFRGTAVTWGDHFMILNEFAECEEDEAT